MLTQQDFPRIQAPLVDDDKQITQIWLQLLISLWKRTGGAQGKGGVPTGAISAFGMVTVPESWLVCDGTAVSRTTYKELFNAIGTTWGAGDNVTTFNLPDLRQRFLSGEGTVGATGGHASVTLAITNLPAHNHGINDPGHAHAVTDPGHNHTQNAHSHTQDAHTHTQDAHTHTQNSHNHTQDSHNHTQDSHNHTQNAHHHSQTVVNDPVDGTTGVRGSSTASTTADGNTGDTTATNNATTATNQATTATNQAATATNQNTTATNQNTTATNQNTTATNISNTTGLTVNSNTTGVTTQNTGSGTAFSILPPFATVLWAIKT